MDNEVADLVRAHLDENKWHYKEREEEDGAHIFSASVSGKNPALRAHEFHLICRKESAQSLFFVPVEVSEANCPQVLEYLNRVNYQFRIGKFTVDMRDGEIRFETVKTLADLRYDREDAMDDLLGFPIFIMDQYLPGLMLVALGVKKAKDAFEEAQAEPKDDGEEPPTEEAPADDDEEGEGQTKRAAKKKKCPTKQTKKGKKAAKAASKADDPTEGEATKDDPKKGGKAKGLRNYSLEGLNLTTSIPLPDIMRAVREFRTGKVCADVDAPRLNVLLSGVPGAGKTSFVKYLAQEVGAPLVSLKASDLMSRYSGETERRIANAFQRAKAQNAILFFDEIDSFLQDRKGSSHSWEVTQVNELLQQMEDFGGIMVGATNFEENLDKAVLRRFTYKVKLDYLTEEGKRIFFKRYFKTELTDSEKSRLEKITNLTPGDFRTVREELYYLSDKQTNNERLNALAAESKAKGASCAPIGFV